VGLLDGRVHVEQFDERHLRDPAVLDLARRVISHPEPALNPIWETTDKAPGDVEVLLKNGARHRLHVDYPRGAPQNPATRAELEAKFDAVAAPVLTGPSRARVRSAVRDLERLTSLTDLMDALVAEHGASRGPASPKR